jgi:hypothetical protein
MNFEKVKNKTRIFGGGPGARLVPVPREAGNITDSRAKLCVAPKAASPGLQRKAS